MEEQEIITYALAVIYGFCMFVIGYYIGHRDAEDENKY